MAAAVPEAVIVDENANKDRIRAAAPDPEEIPPGFARLPEEPPADAGGAQPDAVAIGQPRQWSCPLCTLMNEEDAVACAACGGPRPGAGDGAVVVVNPVGGEAAARPQRPAPEAERERRQAREPLSKRMCRWPSVLSYCCRPGAGLNSNTWAVVPVGLFWTCVFLVLWALSMPGVLVVAAVQLVCDIPFLLYALPLPLEALCCQRVGPYVKLLTLLLAWPAMLLVMLVHWVVLSVGWVAISAVGAAMLYFTEDEEPTPPVELVWLAVPVWAVDKNVLWHGRKITRLIKKLRGAIREPLEPGEQPWDLHPGKALQNLLVAVVGTVVSTLALACLGIALLVPSLFSSLRLVGGLVPSEAKCMCACAPCLLIALALAPVTAALLTLVGLPLRGLILGVEAVMAGSKASSPWSRVESSAAYMKKELDETARYAWRFAAADFS